MRKLLFLAALALAACAHAPQSTSLWETAQREFPDWYEAHKAMEPRARLAALRDLRRQHAPHALKAGAARQQRVAETFVASLGEFRKTGTETCFAFLADGEASAMLAEKSLAPYLNAVLEAIAEGRRSPRVHAGATPADHAALSAALKARSWSGPDFEIFSDAGALQKEPPERACQLVHDFYGAILAVPDPAARGRLLAGALAPIVSD